MCSLAIETRLKVEASNVTPVWLLPYWRLVKTEAKGDYATAWKRLPYRFPRAYPLPSIEEAVMVLLDHKLI